MPAVSFHNNTEDVVMKKTQQKKSLEPLKTSGAVRGAEPVKLGSVHINTLIKEKCVPTFKEMATKITNSFFSN